MLIQFSVKNYRSIKDRVQLNLLASAESEYKDDLIDIKGEKRLLPVAAIYDGNSSDQSNILLALQTMQDMITGASVRLLKDKKLPYNPFMSINNSEPAPTEFEIILNYNGVKYLYGFSYNAKQIVTEALFHWPNKNKALIFSRMYDKYEFGENANEQMMLSSRTSADKLYLISLNEWNAPQTELVYRWFTEKLFSYDEQDTPDATVDVIRGLDNPVLDRAMVSLLLADMCIINMGFTHAEKSPFPMVYRMGDGNGTERFLLPLKRESNGARNLFSRISPWLLALEKGAVLLIDEIGAGMNSLLIRHLVEMMQNPEINKNGAQLIFTTHDVMLLDPSLLRRDQIWITDRNPKSIHIDSGLSLLRCNRNPHISTMNFGGQL